MKSLFFVIILVTPGIGMTTVKSEKTNFKTLDGIELTATIHFPSTSQHKLPGILIVEGSGKSGFNEEPEGSPFVQLANALAEKGFVVFKYNKRGSGENSNNGSFWRSTFTIDRNDAQSAFDELRLNPLVDSSRIFLIGHSFGGPQSLLLATKNKIAGIVMLTSTIGPTDKLMLEQNAILMDLQGTPKGESDKYLLGMQKTLGEIKSGTFKCEFPTCSVIDGAEVWEKSIQVKWLNEVLNLDFTAIAKSVPNPIFFIFGTSDFVIPESEMTAAKSLVPLLSSKSEVAVIPQLDHFMVENESKKASLDYAMQVQKDKKFKNISRLLVKKISDFIIAN
jgi:hypothetical protein